MHFFFAEKPERDPLKMKRHKQGLTSFVFEIHPEKKTGFPAHMTEIPVFRIAFQKLCLLHVTDKCFVALQCFIDIGFAGKFEGSMHVVQRHTAVDDIHAIGS